MYDFWQCLSQNFSQACMIFYLLRCVRNLLLVPVSSGTCFYLLWSQVFDMQTGPLLAVASWNTHRWDREWSWTEDRRGFSKIGWTTVTWHRAQSEMCNGFCLYVTESFLLPPLTLPLFPACSSSPPLLHCWHFLKASFFSLSSA